MSKTEQDYFDIVNSNEFKSKLNILNTSLVKKLQEYNYENVIIGNLFYDHEELNFHSQPLILNYGSEEKRKRFFQIAKQEITFGQHKVLRNY